MIGPPDLAALQRQLSGTVLLPGNSAYQSAVEIDNGRVQLKPRFIVQANSTQDVVLTLRYAEEHKLRLTTKGGGHSATGYSLNSGGIVLDLSIMTRIQLDVASRVVKVQMGARWHDVYVYLINSGTGLIPIGGGCPTVGIPGFMQGGGYSFVSRSYGLSVDNLVAITLVTIDGKVRRVTADAPDAFDRELFWALRGGGGGNWGVAIEMEILAHYPNTEKMLTGQIRYAPHRAQEVLSFYNQWVETLPNEMAVYGIWGQSPDPSNPSSTIQTFGFTTIYNGEFGKGAKLLQPLLELGPLTVAFNQITLPEFELINGATTLVGNRSAYICSGMMPPGAFKPEAITVFERFMASAPSKDSFIVWTHAGGHIEAIPSESTSFAHRAARFVPEVKSIWTNPQDARANIEWAHAFFSALEPYFSGAYVNYIDPLLGNWAKKYYLDHYPRLLKIKQQCDPNGFFDFQQGIGSKFEPDQSEPLDLAPLNRTFVD
jgi:FAD binding domain/Berberine and berberine like